MADQKVPFLLQGDRKIYTGIPGYEEGKRAGETVLVSPDVAENLKKKGIGKIVTPQQNSNVEKQNDQEEETVAHEE